MSKKELLLIIISFIIGEIFMIAIIRYTPLVNIGINNNNNYTKNSSKIYEKSSLAESIDKVKDAVVDVQGYEGEIVNGSGSGFVYKVDNKYGYIMTNEHVISQSNDIRVTFTSDEKAKVKVLGKDELLDLAVLRVDKKYVKSIATIGSSEKMNIGDIVFAIGSPLGYEYRGSVTSGILSGKNRKVKTTVSNSSNELIMDALQFDAPINPGNSGGPLLNINGEVVGICTLKITYDNIEGMGFAIPIDDAMNYIDKLENGEEIKRPVLGISIVNISDSGTLARANISIPDNTTEGVVITDFNDNSTLSSQLKKGDIIVKINNVEISDIGHFKYEIYKHQVGDKVQITYIRNGKEKKDEIILGSE